MSVLSSHRSNFQSHISNPGLSRFQLLKPEPPEGASQIGQWKGISPQATFYLGRWMAPKVWMVPCNLFIWTNTKKQIKTKYCSFESRRLSQAITLVMARFAFALKLFVGKYLIGMQANTNFVHHDVLAMLELHSQINISWFVLNWAPSANHFTFGWF